MSNKLIMSWGEEQAPRYLINLDGVKINFCPASTRLLDTEADYLDFLIQQERASLKHRKSWGRDNAGGRSLLERLVFVHMVRTQPEYDGGAILPWPENDTRYYFELRRLGSSQYQHGYEEELQYKRSVWNGQWYLEGTHNSVINDLAYLINRGIFSHTENDGIATIKIGAVPESFFTFKLRPNLRYVFQDKAHYLEHLVHLYAEFIRNDGLDVKRVNEVQLCPDASESLEQALIAAGIPEEAIESNKELWEFINSIDKDQVVSANLNFQVVDKKKERWRLKITTNREKARIEAAANYYLGNHLDIIVPGKFPEPLQAGQFYITMQKDVSSYIHGRRSLNYWIKALAMFHRDARAILNANSVAIPNTPHLSLAKLQSQYAASRALELKFDKSLIEDSISYLSSRCHQAVIHGDIKSDNIPGPYLFDLEGVTKGDVAIDLAALLMMYGIERRQLPTYVEQYLRAASKEPTNKAIKDLSQGIKMAAPYVAYREIIGSSLRKRTTSTRKNNHKLMKGMQQLCA